MAFSAEIQMTFSRKKKLKITVSFFPKTLIALFTIPKTNPDTNRSKYHINSDYHIYILNIEYLILKMTEVLRVGDAGYDDFVEKVKQLKRKSYTTPIRPQKRPRVSSDDYKKQLFGRKKVNKSHNHRHAKGPRKKKNTKNKRNIEQNHTPTTNKKNQKRPPNIRTDMKDDEVKRIFGACLSAAIRSLPKSAGRAVIPYENGQENEGITVNWVERSDENRWGMSVIDQLGWPQLNLVIATMHQGSFRHGRRIDDKKFREFLRKNKNTTPIQGIV